MSSKSFQNASKLNGIVSVLEFGADPTGATDSSAAINAALAAGNSIEFPWGIYKCKDIVAGTTKSLYCNGSIFKPAAGANWTIKLTGFRPQIFDAYFDGGLADPIPNDGQHAALMVGDDTLNCEFFTIQNCMWVNHNVCLYIGGNNTFTASKGFISQCQMMSYLSCGIIVAKNALDCFFTDINIRAQLQRDSTDTYDIPRRNSIGFYHNATGSTIAFGGHLLNSVTCLNSELGFKLTDSQLVSLENCIADGLCGSGYQVGTTAGGASNHINFSNCFAGTCKVGYEIVGNSLYISLIAPTTKFTGQIPPWSGPEYFLTSGVYAVPRDLYFGVGSNVSFSGWNAFGTSAFSYFFAGTISVSETQGISLGSAATVAAASTVYLTPSGALATDLLAFVAPKRGIIYNLTAQCDTAPGSGQSFTYTARKNSIDQGTVATITGAGVFVGSSNAITEFSQGDNISLKLVTSTTAAASNHRVSLKVAYFG